MPVSVSMPFTEISAALWAQCLVSCTKRNNVWSTVFSACRTKLSLKTVTSHVISGTKLSFHQHIWRPAHGRKSQREKLNPLLALSIYLYIQCVNVSTLTHWKQSYVQLKLVGGKGDRKTLTPQINYQTVQRTSICSLKTAITTSIHPSSEPFHPH